MYYSPSQVSEILGIPASTVRHYAKTFAEYLSPQGARKQRLYTDQDLLVFARIKDLSSANVPLDLIGPRLNVQSQDTAKPQESALALIPTVATELENANAIARAAQAKADELENRLEQLAEQLTEKLENQKTQLDQQNTQLEKIKRWAALPWYKKLFTKPPIE